MSSVMHEFGFIFQDCGYAIRCLLIHMVYQLANPLAVTYTTTDPPPQFHIPVHAHCTLSLSCKVTLTVNGFAN